MTSTATSRIRPVAKFFFDGDRKFFVKGVTYGPFKPDAHGNYLGKPEQVDIDLALMREGGLNLVRIYHAPPRWFLDRCASAGMRVLVTLPWAKHVEFLRDRKTRHEIAEALRIAVSENAAMRRFSDIWSGTKFPAQWCGGSVCAASRNLSRD